jgi:hypothetical protein
MASQEKHSDSYTIDKEVREDYEASIILEFLDDFESVYSMTDRDVIKFTTSVGRIQKILSKKLGETNLRAAPLQLIKKDCKSRITHKRVSIELRKFFAEKGLHYTPCTGGDGGAKYHLEIPRTTADEMFMYRKQVEGRNLLYHRETKP